MSINTWDTPNIFDFPIYKALAEVKMKTINVDGVNDGNVDVAEFTGHRDILVKVSGVFASATLQFGWKNSSGDYVFTGSLISTAEQLSIPGGYGGNIAVQVVGSTGTTALVLDVF